MKPPVKMTKEQQDKMMEARFLFGKWIEKNYPKDYPAFLTYKLRGKRASRLIARYEAYCEMMNSFS